MKRKEPTKNQRRTAKSEKSAESAVLLTSLVLLFSFNSTNLKLASDIISHVQCLIFLVSDDNVDRARNTNGPEIAINHKRIQTIPNLFFFVSFREQFSKEENRSESRKKTI